MSEEIKQLCMEHGKTIASLLTISSDTNRKVDILLEDIRGNNGLSSRIVVLETKEKDQPTARETMTFASAAGSVTVLLIYFGKKLVSIFHP